MSPKNENIKEKAMLFACFAHKGQVRKSEKEKPLIIHPIETGRILEKYGFDENVIAAGYLHDVIEDTKYTKDDILKLFGEDICSLVISASESDKSMSWEDRKLETIRKVRGYNVRQKAVICADKISNLSSLKNLFARKAERDFSCFKRGENLQSWYYTVLHRSLEYGIESSSNEMYDEMKDLIDSIFYSKISNEEMEANLFVDSTERLDKLKRINAYVDELVLFKDLQIMDNIPVVIEFLGTMRAGKTSTIMAISELFKKKGLKVKIVDEYTTSKEFKEEIRPNFNGNILELHQLILEKVYSKIEEAKKASLYDIILVDRGLNDRLIWLLRLFASESKITKRQYEETLLNWEEKANTSADIIVSFKIPAETSMKRDYLSSISLAKRHFMNLDNINQYNKAMTIAMFELFKPKLKIISLSTDNMIPTDASIECTRSILNEIRTYELKRICKKTDEMAELFKRKYEI